MDKRSLWRAGEEIALRSYLDEGWLLVEQNFTIRWGEIDLIVENDAQLAFVEVKIIDALDDVHNYITRSKLRHLSKTIDRYVRAHPTTKTIQLDVVFVQGGSVVETYRNVTLYI